jgi:hypothetical protein
VQVESPYLANTIIENLDGKTVNGLFINSHRYFRRLPSRDRRISERKLGQSEDRRREDRRRNNLITRVVDIT